MEQPAGRTRIRERQPGLNASGSRGQDIASAGELTADHGLFGRNLAAATPKLWVTHAIVAANALVFPGSQAPAAEKLRSLTELVRVRRDMFSEYAAGLKTGDAARIRRAEALSTESQRLMKAMRERPGQR